MMAACWHLSVLTDAAGGQYDQAAWGNKSGRLVIMSCRTVRRCRTDGREAGACARLRRRVSCRLNCLNQPAGWAAAGQS